MLFVLCSRIITLLSLYVYKSVAQSEALSKVLLNKLSHLSRVNAALQARVQSRSSLSTQPSTSSSSSSLEKPASGSTNSSGKPNQPNQLNQPKSSTRTRTSRRKPPEVTVALTHQDDSEGSDSDTQSEMWVGMYVEVEWAVRGGSKNSKVWYEGRVLSVNKTNYQVFYEQDNSSHRHSFVAGSRWRPIPGQTRPESSSESESDTPEPTPEPTPPPSPSPPPRPPSPVVIKKKKRKLGGQRAGSGDGIAGRTRNVKKKRVLEDYADEYEREQERQLRSRQAVEPFAHPFSHICYRS